MQAQCLLILLGWEMVRDGQTCQEVWRQWSPALFGNAEYIDVCRRAAEMGWGSDDERARDMPPHNPPNPSEGAEPEDGPLDAPLPPGGRGHDLEEVGQYVQCRHCFKKRQIARAYELRSVPCRAQYGGLRHEVGDLGEVNGHDVRMVGTPNEGQLCQLRCHRCERRHIWSHRSNFRTFACKGAKWEKQLARFDWQDGASAQAVRCLHCGWQTAWNFKATSCRAHARRCVGHQ